MAPNCVIAFALAATGLSASNVFAQGTQNTGMITAILTNSDRVDLLPGQTIIFKPDKGKMTRIRFVDGPMEPGEGELKLEFGMLGGQTSLIATSKSELAYTYRAEIVKHLGAKKGKPTSVCTIMAGGGAFEVWPGKIPVLRVMDFKPATDGNMVCR